MFYTLFKQTERSMVKCLLGDICGRYVFLWGIGFTVYLLLDTFAIRRVYTVVPQIGSSVGNADNSSKSQLKDSESDDIDVVADVADTYSAGDTEIDAAVTDSEGAVEMDVVDADSKENTGAETIETTDTGSAVDVDDENTSSTPVTTYNSYSDGNISIILTEYRRYDTTIYVTDVQITSVSDLKTACALVYEHYSHGVTSYYMMCAFIIPLLGGFLVNLIIKSAGFMVPGERTSNLYIVTLTTGCIVKGVLDIYGTTNHLMVVYLIAGAALFLAGLFHYINRVQKMRVCLKYYYAQRYLSSSFDFNDFRNVLLKMLVCVFFFVYNYHKSTAQEGK